jgi:alginate O-acetyltransferase complex protein AlgI
MLFNTLGFIFAFAPITVLGFYLLGRHDKETLAILWLVACSFFFYAWWNPPYISLIFGSILFNFYIGSKLSSPNAEKNKSLLTFGIACNLLLLVYFKYTGFLIDNINSIFELNISVDNIILPLAISFFTFQQITYLVDSYRLETREYSFLKYCLYVSFFPQLIAGPIVHHREMMPQFNRKAAFRFKPENISLGLTVFIIGLFKKIVIADGIEIYATPVFDAAASGSLLSFTDAWIGAIAYTLQLYFDFSGYSDMAIGLACLFGIKLPINFNSPYKATNIIDFWRRWHITLSRFLRDYLYIPLGGNRKGNFRRYTNLMITMILGGLWHGAGWTFLIWGSLHGFYLVINNAWRWLVYNRLGYKHIENNVLYIGICGLITFIVVIIAWVVFRADDFTAAVSMLQSMFMWNSDIDTSLMTAVIEKSHKAFYHLTALLLVIWLLPNTQQITGSGIGGHYKLATNKRMTWKPSIVWLAIITVMLIWALSRISEVSQFLYYQF